MALFRKADPLEAAKADLQRKQRDLAKNLADQDAARNLVKEKTEAGADDAEIDAAEREVVRLIRAKPRLERDVRELREIVAELSSDARKVARAKNKAKATQSGAALADALRGVADLWYAYINDRAALDAADLSAFPVPPPFIVSLANANSATFGKKPAANPALDHFVWAMTQITREAA